jgi:hypothetical protein
MNKEVTEDARKLLDKIARINCIDKGIHDNLKITYSKEEYNNLHNIISKYKNLDFVLKECPAKFIYTHFKE